MHLLCSSLLLAASCTETQQVWIASSFHLESGEGNFRMNNSQLHASILWFLTTWTWWLSSWEQLGYKQGKLMEILFSRESPTPSILGGVESSWVCQCVHGLSTIMHCPKSGSGVGQLIWDKVTSLLSTAVSNPGYMLTCFRNLQKLWCAGPPHMGVWVSTVWDIKPWHSWLELSWKLKSSPNFAKIFFIPSCFTSMYLATPLYLTQAITPSIHHTFSRPLEEYMRPLHMI